MCFCLSFLSGPCQAADNHCQNGAYCQTNDGVATCICMAGFSGPTCNKGIYEYLIYTILRDRITVNLKTLTKG